MNNTMASFVAELCTIAYADEQCIMELARKHGVEPRSPLWHIALAEARLRLRDAWSERFFATDELWGDS